MTKSRSAAEPWKSENHRRLEFIRRFISRLLMTVGLTVVVVTFTPVLSWWARVLSGPMTNPRGDVLIVLGAAAAINDEPMPASSYLRITYGLQAFREGGFKTVVVTGGGATPVAKSMREFLINQGVPDGAIIAETRSKSTRENALFVKEALSPFPSDAVLLTSDYHMFRARRVFERCGMHVKPRPFPDALKRSTRVRRRWDVFLDLSVETVKIAYYAFRGWL